MNDYEAKQQSRKERYEERARKARAESESRHEAGMSMFRQMDGQPILIGHHSEKSHRGHIKRADGHLRKSSEAAEKAKHYEEKAAGVGKAGISADDPEAVRKLKEKLAALDRENEHFKKVNAAWRKAKKPRANQDRDYGGPDREAEDAAKWERFAELLDAAGCGASLNAIRANMRRDMLQRAPYSYHGGNNRSEARRVRQRIADLKQAEAMPEAEDIEGDGFTITEDREINRLCIEFPGKPPAEIRTRLKQNGFRWNRGRMAWTRQLNQAARHAAQRAMEVEK